MSRSSFSKAAWILALGLAVPAFARDRKPASSDFKFPVLLCVYQTTIADEQNGLLQLVHRETGEYAYRVDSSGNTGKANGTYEIDQTPFRVRFDAQIVQAIDGGRTDSLQIHSVLEKKDPATGEYSLVSQRQTVGTDVEASDGSIWKNVSARIFNTDFSDLKNEQGKLDQNKVNLAFRDGKLVRGSMVISGPVCGLLDLGTVRKVTSHADELRDVFARYDRAKAREEAAQKAAEPVVAQDAPQPEAQPQAQAPAEAQPMPAPSIPPEAAGLAEVQQQQQQMTAPQIQMDGAQAAVPPNQPVPDLATQQAMLEQQRQQIELQQQQLQSQIDSGQSRTF